MGEQVDEEFLQNHQDAPESESNSSEELHARLAEISLAIEDNLLFIEEEKRKEAHRKVHIFAIVGVKCAKKAQLRANDYPDAEDNGKEIDAGPTHLTSPRKEEAKTRRG